MPPPKFIQVEPSTKCNLDCETRTRSDMSSTSLNEDLTLPKFKEILREIPSIEKIKLQGIGGLLNPDLWEILNIGAKRGI